MDSKVIKLKWRVTALCERMPGRVSWRIATALMLLAYRLGGFRDVHVDFDA